MKKQLLTLLGCWMMGSMAVAQTVIYDSGPLFDQTGVGVGGANASTLHDGMGTYGAGHAAATGFRVAEDIIVNPGESWYIDSLIFYAYQTNSGNISTITDVNLKIWNGLPDDAASTVVFGDGATNLLFTSEWCGAYRTGDFGSATCDPTTCNARPIMRNAIIVGTTLGPGTYWIDWQTGGSGASGPWVPPVNLGAGVTTTGNAKQFDPTAVVWNDLFDGSLLTEAQGLPFQVIGTITTGLNDITSSSSVTVSPNPMSTNAVFNIRIPATSNNIMLNVYDALGNKVRSENNIAAGKYTFNRGSLSNGVYMYEVIDGGSLLKNGKLVIE